MLLVLVRNISLLHCCCSISYVILLHYFAKKKTLFMQFSSHVTTVPLLHPILTRTVDLFCDKKERFEKQLSEKFEQSKF